MAHTLPTTITLAQFERIDGLMSQLLRMGDFETCADPRGYIRTSNVLLDTLYDVVGREWADEFPDSLEAAAAFVTSGLLSASFVGA
jgi:hypothetical protein